MKTFWMSLAVVAALGFVPATHAADLARPARFGSLEVASADAAKAQAAAWLKQAGLGEAAQARFEQIWKGEGTVLEKTTRTFELDPALATLLADARDTGKVAPTQLPAVLKDAKAGTYFRNNFALVFGRVLTNRSIHNEALEAFKMTRPEMVIDPAAYLFHRALSEHALLNKDAAITSIDRLLDDVGGSPERFRTLAALMALDMHTWNEKDLGAIARKMKIVEDRLDLARGGPQTQKIQKEIVARLDEMIKELENKKNGNCDCNGGQCPGGGKPGSGPPNGNNPSSPATESGIANAGGSGQVDSTKLKRLVDNWGNLPPREQARALQELTQGMSARHREAIENYFRNLAAAQSRSK